MSYKALIPTFLFYMAVTNCENDAGMRLCTNVVSMVPRYSLGLHIYTNQVSSGLLDFNTHLIF